jgi:cell division septal protein FtsQ
MHSSKVFEPGKSKYLVFTADYLIPTFISFALLFFGYLVFYSPFFTITEVICSSNYQECTNPALIAELDKLKAQNIFTLSAKNISHRLTSGDFTIREVNVIKELPSTLKLYLQSVYPVVAIKVAGDPTWIVTDDQFRVIGQRSSDPNVPTVVVSGPITLIVGKKPSDELIIKSLALARKLADELFSVKTITLIDADTLELSLSTGKKAIFTPKKDVLVQLRALQAVLSDATIVSGAKTIDVRFSQPVLR